MRNSSWSRAVRIFIFIVISTVLWLQLAIPPLPNEPPNSAESLEDDVSLLPQYSPVRKFFQLNKSAKQVPVQPVLSKERIQEIREQILYRSSENETILNEELFGPVYQDTIVIVVQVHNRLEYLRHLISSLAIVRHIEKILLIFSHDYYNEDINNLIITIDFCMVTQIFYPHSLQTHPFSYPGHTAGDCPRDTKPKFATSARCVGNPDRYGHYREPRYTQTKHHWWWKANKVFDNLFILKNHTGLVLFLEEDHYVAEDAIHMVQLLKRTLPRACPKCSVITLGNYLKNFNFVNDARKVELATWISSKHNMGFAFNHSVWLLIKNCTAAFCNHDDYNWDWSLQHVSGFCLNQRLLTMALRAPRVFHIGECGVHHKKVDCSSKILLQKVHRVLSFANRGLFPREITVISAPIKKFKRHKGNGGWGDRRDHALCRSFSVSVLPLNDAIVSLVPDPMLYFPSGRGANATN